MLYSAIANVVVFVAFASDTLYIRNIVKLKCHICRILNNIRGDFGCLIWRPLPQQVYSSDVWNGSRKFLWKKKMCEILQIDNGYRILDESVQVE